MYMGAYTRISAAVFMTMCGGFRAHPFVCVHIQGPQPEMATHPGKKKMANNFFLFQIYIYKLIIGQYLQIYD